MHSFASFETILNDKCMYMRYSASISICSYLITCRHMRERLYCLVHRMRKEAYVAVRIKKRSMHMVYKRMFYKFMHSPPPRSFVSLFTFSTLFLFIKCGLFSNFFFLFFSLKYIYIYIYSEIVKI